MVIFHAMAKFSSCHTKIPKKHDNARYSLCVNCQDYMLNN